MVNDNDDDYYEPLCGYCNGTGEGRASGSRCPLCNGSGVDDVDEDDWWDWCDDDDDSYDWDDD